MVKVALTLEFQQRREKKK